MNCFLLRNGKGPFSGSTFVHLLGGTWRTIPVSKWLITMGLGSPQIDRVVGPLLNGPFMVHEWGLLYVCFEK